LQQHANAALRPAPNAGVVRQSAVSDTIDISYRYW